jgi:two-component system, chemotaxis family, protein-glutamate methylesterase/glutaminase
VALREAERGGAPARVVGIGASAGGVDALIQVVRELPADLSAAICVVLHVPSSGTSLLAPILGRHTRLAVEVASDGARLCAGCVYVAPNDRHLLIADGAVMLDRGPKENGVRPAVDTMLRSLAASRGADSVAVILSGALGDGSAGALAVRRAGGTVIVQDPGDATVPSMPESALRAVGRADAVLAAAAIGPALATLAGSGATEEDVAMAHAGDPAAGTPARPAGAPSSFTCPECHGPLWEMAEGDLYRCRVGHGFSEDALVIEQGSATEAALWSALEALEERAEFLARVAARHGSRRPRLRDRFTGGAEDALERAELIRSALGTRREGPHALDLHADVAE